MKTKALLVLSIYLIAARPNSAHAWGDLGHQIVGAVAEARIQPETKDFVRGILGIEPLGVAANWPDHVRDDARFGSHESDFAPLHFSEVPTGFSFETRPVKYSKDAYSALVGASRILSQSSGITSEEKIIALRYLIHIVGDIHQPLHVGNGFDRGGNECQIKTKQKAKPGVFHSFWDTALVLNLGESYKNDPQAKVPKYYPQFIAAMKVQAGSKFNADKLKFSTQDDASFASDVSTKLISWLDDSAKLRETIYPDDLNGNPQAYKMRAYCRWYSDQFKSVLGDTSAKKIKDSEAQLLPTDYVSKNIPLVETQLIKGGIHLASLLDAIALRAIANNSSLPTLTDDQQTAILKKFLIEMQH